ncbi:peptidoglycan-binding domain-containing protein [Micromonospora sp. NPDC049523]|uniref:peptidoglycan-binding domain-containing protein n=1 Tax=Micromonospora sp. NPDC049523 TaxID=3155921 RepID=UPI003424B761
MSTETADPVAVVLSTAVRTLPEEDRRWPMGPVRLGGENKAFSPNLDQYLAWVAEVESRVRDSAETVQRLRMLHYGRHGNFAPFDWILSSRIALMGTPLTLAQGPQEALDGLLTTGSVTTFTGDSSTAIRPAVELSHVWVCADAALNGLGVASTAGLATMTDPFGAISWTADLASWWQKYNKARRVEMKAAKDAGREWTEPTDPAGLATPTGWLDAAAGNCAVDDLLGDMDGIILMSELAALDPKLTTPLTDLLRRYYGPGPAGTGGAPPDRRVLHSDNRFHLFVQRSQPEIPHWYDEPTGTVILDPQAEATIQKEVRSCAAALILALDRSDPEDDLDSPWGRAMLEQIVARFAQFLRNGLATDGWNVGSWQQGRQALDAYGGQVLRIGDSDADRRYGGVVRADAPRQTHVRTLQDQLAQVGFPTLDDPSGIFGPRTASALREFQISARFARVQNVRLDDAGNPVGQALESAVLRYHGRIHGCLDRDTATVLAAWLDPKRDRTKRTRNAATVDAYQMAGTVPGAVVVADLWRPDDVTDPTLGEYATDHLERHPIPPARRLPGEPGRVALGRYAVPDGGAGTPGGPVLAGSALWPEAALTPDTLVPAPALPVGTPPPPPTSTELSTYRVLRAVAEAGGGTHFDAVDASGADRLRLGPLRWALGADGFGELAALLAYYQSWDPTGYQRDFGRYGIWPEQPWQPDGIWSAGDAGHRSRHLGRLGMYGLRDAAGRVHPGALLPLGPADGYLLDHLRGWHALHRLVMTLRTTDGLRRAMWRFSVERIDRLRRRRWREPAGANPPGPQVRDPSGALRDATLGEVFTSEQAVAALLRWHTGVPEQVLGEHGAEPGLRAVFEAVHGPGPQTLGPPTGDEADTAQVALVAKLVDLAPSQPAGFGASVATAAGFDGLSPFAGSFRLAL